MVDQVSSSTATSLAASPTALTLVDSASAEATEQQSAAPRWSLAKRILFRFAFAYLLLMSSTYLVLYFLPIPFGLDEPYAKLWSFLVGWAGDSVFHADTSVLPNASGDTTYNYVQVFCFLLLALVATAVWTFLDRRRSNYLRLQEWLRVYVRLALAFWMLDYAAVKVIPAQFPSPPLDRLLQPIGDASPGGLLWTFMGASAAYTIFSGLAELLGGLLLLARRTALLGALVCVAVLTNVVALNFCYDVPVKLFSLQLLVMALFLTLPELGRLANVFVFNRTTEPAEIPPLFARQWLDRGARVLPSVLVLGFAALQLNQVRLIYNQFVKPASRPPLYGIWNVEEFILDGTPRPPLVGDEVRWRRVVFDEPRAMAILTDTSRQRFPLDLEPAAHRLTLAKRGDPGWRSRFSFHRPDPHLLTMEGTFDGHQIRARLRRAANPEFRLVSRGFHWITEIPYNG